MRATALTVTALFVCGYATYAAAGDKSLANGAAAVNLGEKKSTSMSASPAQGLGDQLLKPANVSINIQVGAHALSVAAGGPVGPLQSLANSAGRMALGDISDGTGRLELRVHPGDYSVRSDARSRILSMP
jgi:hypothetical protein